VQRVIIIGDVHGCVEELDELLSKVQCDRNRDRIVFVGDLVDRGPDPVGVVRRARELGAECVLGNHEEKHIRWHRWEHRVATGEAEKNPMQAFPEDKLRLQAALTDDEWTWLERLPLFIRLDARWAVIHGGCIPNVSLERQGKNIVRVRYVDLATRKFKPTRPGEIIDGTRYWSELWLGPENLVYGHAVHDLEKPRHDFKRDLSVKGSVPAECYGIDTGCCFGGRLTACILEEGIGRFVSVPAKRRYWDQPVWTNE